MFFFLDGDGRLSLPCHPAERRGCAGEFPTPSLGRLR